MKRNFEVIMTILTALETDEVEVHDLETLIDAAAKGNSAMGPLFGHHIRILLDAGLLARENHGIRLTWAGHEYLAEARLGAEMAHAEQR
ncbi:Uncharacterised protein [Bordetella ansorpii]|uniref:Uncharacterized protein n=1 Tax=Bordetella ansorpii TaxID=288768 RepID=A0A157RH20_9BORD|nr:hypothetical protein [Bordetella ansorpii]SAI56699.1 Uncharacterised protein [Bordetella ansorpii]